MTSPGLFAAFGIELEYMIVDAATLDVRPVSDRILFAMAGAYESEVEAGELAWSNELVGHVIELKTNGPRASLDGLGSAFRADVGRINGILRGIGARLMPTAMHPWMDPHAETRLWEHEYNGVYEAFDRIFDCRGHGWSNLQSVHVNLPFQGDAEFGRLHAAIRLVLPLLPALAASSPISGGTATGIRDTRLDHYRRNCARVPEVTGAVIPERVFTRAAYQELLLEPLYRAIAPLDTDGVLQDEWLNARGAIARFDRDTIEIRLLDIQECPAADMAVVALVVGLVRALVNEAWISTEDQMKWPEHRLAGILDQTIRSGEDASIDDMEYLGALGIAADAPMTAGELWRDIIRRLEPDLDPAHAAWIELYLGQGTLASRILRSWDKDRTRASLGKVYGALCACLDEDRLFTGDV
jgi:glutamate---cysteine ligase / carboxylate-amine ligase